MEKEKITHEQHLEIMVKKYTQEVEACYKCGCPTCKRSVAGWEEQILRVMDELEFFENG